MLILASASPRRKYLLENAGCEFLTIVPEVEEIVDPLMPLEQLCQLNAKIKAEAVAKQHANATVIGADTLVAIDSRILGKPADLLEAREMLSALSGRTHVVCTGVCLIFPDGRIDCFSQLTEVTFAKLGNAEIDAYFARVNPLDKAGAYGIQEHGNLLGATISGSFDNVMGLPVTEVLSKLA